MFLSFVSHVAPSVSELVRQSCVDCWVDFQEKVFKESVVVIGYRDQTVSIPAILEATCWRTGRLTLFSRFMPFHAVTVMLKTPVSFRAKDIVDCL